MPGVYDTIVIGSGYGATMAAYPLVHAGERVLMLERGPHVARGPWNWEPDGTLELTPFMSERPSYDLDTDCGRTHGRSVSCVGGQSVFAGTVAMRYRKEDLEPGSQGTSRATRCWPFEYSDLEPYYCRAEELLSVAGDPRGDPTAPPRSAPYPRMPAPLNPVSERVAAAGESLGLSPFKLPLAIDFRGSAGRTACTRCSTCDTFPCAVGAKNDLATTVIPALVKAGLKLCPETTVVRLIAEGDRIVGARCVTSHGVVRTYYARRFILAAGSLASAHLLLASGIDRLSPARDAVGRYLTRHCNAIVMGLFPRALAGGRSFHKQVAFHDFYLSRPGGGQRALGAIQQVTGPPLALFAARLPRTVRRLAPAAVARMTGLLVMAEDDPRPENGLTVAPADSPHELPGCRINHRYSQLELERRRQLIRRAGAILRAAGAIGCYVHPIDTFSHALGTVRMGTSPATSPLDADCRFRGVRNLYVTDGSALPSSAAVNPSLTIAANALRVGERLASRRPAWSTSTPPADQRVKRSSLRRTWAGASASPKAEGAGGRSAASRM